MFKMITRSLTVLLLVAGAAQARPGQPGFGGMPGMRGGGIEQMLQRLSRAADELQITDQQLDQIFAVVDASRGDFRDVMRQMRDNRKALRTSADPDNYDADAVAALAASQGELSARMIVLKTRVHADIAGILTSEQRARIKDSRERRRGKHGH